MSEENRFEFLGKSFQARFRNGSDAEIDAEVADLAETLRCEALELEKSINKAYDKALEKGYPLDVIDLRQRQYRLQELYKQITGFGVNEFWDKVTEQEA